MDKNLKILKSLGQNFLVDKNIIVKVIEAGEIKPDDFVLEVGPGRGALTFELAKCAEQVLAIEKDKGLAQELDEAVELQGIKNIEIIHGDALKQSLSALPLLRGRNLSSPFIRGRLGGGIKIISNPPYKIGARLLVDFLASDNPPEKIVFVIQKEIAQRVSSKPNDMNILAVIMQAFGNPKIIASVPRGCFYPQPRVDSAILCVDAIKNTGIADKKKFVAIVKAGFSSKRKFLLNNLAEKLDLNKEELREIFQKVGLSEKVRAEELEVEEWIKIVKSL